MTGLTVGPYYQVRQVQLLTSGTRQAIRRYEYIIRLLTSVGIGSVWYDTRCRDLVQLLQQCSIGPKLFVYGTLIYTVGPARCSPQARQLCRTYCQYSCGALLDVPRTVIIGPQLDTSLHASSNSDLLFIKGRTYALKALQRVAIGPTDEASQMVRYLVPCLVVDLRIPITTYAANTETYD